MSNPIALCCMLLIMVITISASWYCKRYITSLDDFYVCGRNGSWWLFAGTTAATAMSMWTLIGAAGLASKWGLVPAMLYFSAIGIVIFVFFIGPPFRRAGFSTIPEFFGSRYASDRVKSAAVLCTIVSLLSYIVVQLQGGAILMEEVLGIPYLWGILLFSILLIVGLLFSGMWAVVVTDAIGCFIIVCISIYVLFYMIYAAGGWSDFLIGSIKHTDVGYWRPMGNSGLPMSHHIANNLCWTVITAASPHLLNRALIVKDVKELYKGGVASLLIIYVVASAIMLAFTGAINFLNLSTVPMDYVAVNIALGVLPPLVGGLYLGGAFSAGITTANTQVITCAQGFAKDIYQSIISPQSSEKDVLRLTSYSMIVVLIICGVITAFRPWFMVMAGTVTGVILSFGYFPSLVAGLFWEGVTAKAAEYTMWASVPASILVVLGWTTYGWFQPHPVIWGVLFGLVCIVSLSMLTKKTESEIKAWQDLKPVLFSRDPEMRYEKRDGRFIGIIAALIVLWSLILIMLLMCWGPFKIA